MRGLGLRAPSLAALLAGLAGCGGGGAECGNGTTEVGEECDDGNSVDDDYCTNTCQANVVETLDATIKWTLVAQEVPGFNETCGGVGASKIHIIITGPEAFDQVFECSYAQTPFNDLEQGDYQVRAQLLDISDVAVSGEVDAAFTIAAADVEVVLDFPFSTFPGAYLGTFFFSTRWGGQDACALAAPPVVQQRLRLERDGVPFMEMTTGGARLDGTMPSPCEDFSNDMPQSVLMLPWGPAQMTVTGLDSTGTPQFRETFDTFLGAGVANPLMIFDVNSLAPDAGPPDASPPDAGVPDAGAPDAT